MRDGVTLSADVTRPDTAQPVPVVLLRTPYTKVGVVTGSSQTYAQQGEWWAQQGYAFVVQDVRGRGDSTESFIHW